MSRIYSLPKIGDGNRDTLETAYRPAYFSDRDISAVDSGLGRFFIVKADVTPEEHDAISKQSDVLAFPDVLETLVGDDLSAVQAKCEAFGIPADGITRETSYSVLMEWIARVCKVGQQVHEKTGRPLLPDGVTLDAPLASVEADQKAALFTTVEALGVDTVAAKGAPTFRAALKACLDQVRVPVVLGDRQERAGG